MPTYIVQINRSPDFTTADLAEAITAAAKLAAVHPNGATYDVLELVEQATMEVAAKPTTVDVKMKDGTTRQVDTAAVEVVVEP